MTGLLTEWYQLRKKDSMVDHGVIAGGYTNNDVVKFDKIDLDRFRKVITCACRLLYPDLQVFFYVALRVTRTPFF
jgi:hypothetical protein